MLNKSNFQPFYSALNHPNSYRDSITGTVYTYATGDADGRETALRSLRDAQITAIQTLINGGYTTLNHIGNLTALQQAYARSQA